MGRGEVYLSNKGKLWAKREAVWFGYSSGGNWVPSAIHFYLGKVNSLKRIVFVSVVVVTFSAIAVSADNRYIGIEEPVVGRKVIGLDGGFGKGKHAVRLEKEKDQGGVEPT